MSTEIILSLLSFAGGIAMFIYGMNAMASGLQQAAGEKTRHILEMLTKNRFLAVLVGALVTAVIQSSSGTTVMVVGFVNAGLMSLMQAVGVIMGANIGTTMTAWIVSMGEWASFLKPEVIAPVLLFAGVAIDMFAKSSRLKQGTRILTGFGLLFIGLSTMSSAIKPYASSPIFSDAFTIIGNNPIFGILTGFAVTAVLQSSSASLGILQTLALTGSVSWEAAVFIALGQNIGTCVTALISAFGADTNAKRAAMIHLEFNVIGALAIGSVIAVYFMFNPVLAASPISSTALAIFHTIFNISATVLLFPFAKGLVYLSKKLIPDAKKEETSPIVHLDARLLSNPRAALEVLDREIREMGSLTLNSVSLSRSCLIDNMDYDQIAKTNDLISLYNKQLTAFLEKLDFTGLSRYEQNQALHLRLAARDLHRIEARTSEIAELSMQYVGSMEFDEQTIENINTMYSMTYHALKKALEMMDTRSVDLYDVVCQDEDQLDHLGNSLRKRYIDRMAKDQTNAVEGSVFLEAIDNYERISDHAKSLARYIALEINPASA